MKYRELELLAPAGNLEKLKVAVSYGCDAVYLGGQKYGLRSAAENFTDQEIEEGVNFAHRRDVKVYVVLNSFLHDEDFSGLLDFVAFLKQVGVDALIVSDLGVINLIRKNCPIPIHLSTQASCLNSEAGKFWQKMGVERLILGREVSLQEASKIKADTGLEVELFGHGSLCMAYSGNCVISNYTQGRDSNRGGCAHNCRFEYTLDFGKEKQKSHFMSSKDLMGISQIPNFLSYGISSLKIEGRMKTHLYLGTIVKAYREVIDHYQKFGKLKSSLLTDKMTELKKVAHRDYTEGSLLDKAGSDSIFDDREHLDQSTVWIGQVVEVKDREHILLQVRNPFHPNDKLELLPFTGREKKLDSSLPVNVLGEDIVKAKPGSLVKLPFIEGVECFNLVRGKAL
jgi:putative protease